MAVLIRSVKNIKVIKDLISTISERKSLFSLSEIEQHE